VASAFRSAHDLEDSKAFVKAANEGESEADERARWRVAFVCINVVICLVLAILQLQLSWQHSHFSQPLTPAMDGLKIGLTGLTFLMLLQITELAWFRHLNSEEFLRDQDEASQLGFLWSISFWFELILCALHAPADFMHIPAADEWNLFVLARIYWFLRAVFYFSSVYRMKRSVQAMVRQSDSFLKMREEGGVAQAPSPYSTSTIVKIFFSEHAWELLICSTLVVFFAMSYAVYVCERAEQPDLFTFGNSLYFTATMITTIGSSIQPNHPFGRTLSLIASLFGVAFLSLSVVVLLDTLRLQGAVELESMASVEIIKSDMQRKKHAAIRARRHLKQ